MATPTMNQSKPRREMVEAKAAEQFKFEKIGQVLEGSLRRMEPIMVNGKEAIEYLFENEDGIRCTCLGTADLNKKINPNHIGHWLQIRYESDQRLPNQQEGHSDMKIFRVLVSKEPF